jgi:hypothetical protein
MPWPTEDVAVDPSLGLALCRLAMGMDGLYRRTRARSAETALSAEGLVPVDLWRGEPLGLADWPVAREAVAALQGHSPSLADPVRRTFVEDTLVSLATIVDWQAGDDGLTFRERAARLLGLTIEPIPSAQLSAWRSIVEPVRSGEELHIVPVDQIDQIFRAHLEEAHHRAQETVGDLPPRPLMHLELAHDVPYTAYCDYQANTMRLNADQPFTSERLKLLVLHEAYPGHDYHLWRREHDVHVGRQPLDSLLVITNTPSSPLFEGIGDNGALFLDWLDDAERLHFELGKLRSAACVNACLMLHEDGESPERVREFLIEDGLGQPSWATTRVRFMQDALRAPFVFAYYLGFRSVFDASAAWRGTRTEFYQSLYGRMHSPGSLQLSADLSERNA